MAMKSFAVTSKDGKVYQIERVDKTTPVRYLVCAASDEQAKQICEELASDTQATIEKYDIDVCLK